MPFTSSDNIIQKISTLGNFDEYWFFKTGNPAIPNVCAWQTYFPVAGKPAAGGTPATTPGTAYTADATSITFPNVSPSVRYLLNVEATISQQRPDAFAANNSTMVVFDRLVAVSGVAWTGTGNQTVNSGALPRYSGTAAANVQCWLEVTSAVFVTAPVLDLNSYTQDDGTAGISAGFSLSPQLTSGVIPSSAMLGPMPLNATSKGIRSIEVGLHVSVAAGGAFNIMLLRQLATLSINWNAGGVGYGMVDCGSRLDGLPQIFDGASLGFMMLAGTGSADNAVQGCIRTAYTP